MKSNLSYVLMMVVVGVLAMVVVIVQLQPASAEEYLQVTVQEGDTLWELSKQYNHYHDFSTERFVTWVEHENNIHSSSIMPGQKIILPVKLGDTQIVMNE